MKLIKIENNNNLDKITIFKALIVYCFEFKVLRILKKFLNMFIKKFSIHKKDKQNIRNLNDDEKNFLQNNKSFLKFIKKEKTKIYA